MPVLIIWCHAVSADAIIMTGQGAGGGGTLSCFLMFLTFVSKRTSSAQMKARCIDLHGAVRTLWFKLQEN